MGSKDAVEKLKVFLESTPPNMKARIPGLAKVHLLTTSGADSRRWVVGGSGPRRLELHCDVDDGVRRFEASDENSLGNSFHFLTYVCRDCGVYEKTYALKMVLQRVGGDGIAEVMKLGEYPPFGAPISARIQKLLGNDDLELYRKGSRSEAQGLGIGAATYFRRIVDSH